MQAGAWSGRYRVVTIDVPGHGRSGAAANARDWSIEAFGADVAAVVDALGLDEVVLIGHSMGGAVGIEAALRLGRRCRLLLGVDTFTEATFYRRRPASEIAARRRAFERDFAGEVRTMVERIVAPQTGREAVRWISQAMGATDAATAVAVLEALLDWDIESRWPLLTCPVEAINSALLAQNNDVFALARLCPVMMDGGGHFPMLEDAAACDVLARAIIERRLAG